MSTKKVVRLGCGTVALVVVIVIAIIIGWFIHISQDVAGTSISIDSPLDVKFGEIFLMTVTVKNEREKNDLSVSDIDISDDYLKGFVIISTEPRSKSSSHIANCMSYTFNTVIPAGATMDYIFSLRAEQTGIFRGDIDVWEGQRVITTTAQTVVK